MLSYWTEGLPSALAFFAGGPSGSACPLPGVGTPVVVEVVEGVESVVAVRSGGVEETEERRVGRGGGRVGWTTIDSHSKSTHFP